MNLKNHIMTTILQLLSSSLHEQSDTCIKIKDPSTNRKLSIDNLMDEIKAVAYEKYEVDIRDLSILIALLAISRPLPLMRGTNIMIASSKNPPRTTAIEWDSYFRRKINDESSEYVILGKLGL